MTLTTQLRIILLLVGAAIWLGIYLMGKRRAAPRALIEANDADELPEREAAVFTPADEIDEEALETPAYMRRQGQRDARQDYEPRIANVRDYDGIDALHDADQEFVDIAVHNPRRDVAATHEDIHIVQSVQVPTHVELTPHPVIEPATPILQDEPRFDSHNEPRVSDDAFVVSAASEPRLSVALSDFDASNKSTEPMFESETTPTAMLASIAAPMPTTTPVPVMAEPVVTAYHAPVRSQDHPETPKSTPTLSEVVRQPAPLPESPAPATKPAPDNTKAANNPAARRKIIALRLPMPERVAGDQLLSLLQREQLQHGKFSIFHRMHDAQTVFSVASMVEPGTFDPVAMAQQQFPGITLFMLLPGPLDGLIAYDQMMSCAQRIAHATGGTLQDERGNKLTVQTMERLREEVLDFQHLIGSVATAQ